MCSRSPRRFIFQVQRVHQGLEKVCSLIGATRKVAWNGEGSSSKTIKKRKEGGEREKKRYRKVERRDNRSSTGRQNIPKDPWRIRFSHIQRGTEGEEKEVAATIKWKKKKKKWKYVCPIFLSALGRSHDNVRTANKRVATIGGANAHSRRDRLSFVTSFTLSNDTHRFWTFLRQPSRHLASTPAFIISSFFRVPPLLPRAPLFPFLPAPFRRYHRVSRFFFHAAHVPSRRLNSIC